MSNPTLFTRLTVSIAIIATAMAAQADTLKLQKGNKLTYSDTPIELMCIICVPLRHHVNVMGF